MDFARSWNEEESLLSWRRGSGHVPKKLAFSPCLLLLGKEQGEYLPGLIPVLLRRNKRVANFLCLSGVNYIAGRYFIFPGVPITKRSGAIRSFVSSQYFNSFVIRLVSNKVCQRKEDDLFNVL